MKMDILRKVHTNITYAVFSEQLIEIYNFSAPKSLALFFISSINFPPTPIDLYVWRSNVTTL